MFPAVDFTPFEPEHLAAAGELLAARHARDRTSNPLIPGRFAELDGATAALGAVWRHEHTSGACAWQDGQLAGFIVGEVRIDTLRGRSAWMQLPGHALAAGQPPGLIADLYAAAAPQWVRWGAFDHYVMIPATDHAGLQEWFALSFGQEQALALRPLDHPLPQPVAVPGVQIRLADASDHDQLVGNLSPVVSDHMTRAPVWGVALPEYDVPRREGFAELLADDDVHIWAAFADGRMLAYQIFLPVTPADDNLITPENCILLELAATLPEARGRGIGRALTAQGLAYARELGNTCCLVDWRTTNREAHRFWQSQGFVPAAYRLVRRIDPRIAWAGAQ